MPASAPSALLSRHHRLSRLSRLSCLSRLLRCLLPGVLLRYFLLAAFCFAVCLSLRLHAAACSAATCIAVSCSPPAQRPAPLLPASLSVSLSAYTLLPVPPPPVSLSLARLLPGVQLRCFQLRCFQLRCFQLRCLSLSAYTLLPVPPPPVLLSLARLLPGVQLRCLLLRCLSLRLCLPPVLPRILIFSVCASLLLSPSCSSSCSAAPSGRSELVPASVPGTSGFAPSSPPLFLSTSACSYSFSSVFTASSFMVFSRRFVCRLLLLFPPFRRLPLLPFLRSFLLFRRFPALSACPPPVLPPPIRKHPRR